MSETITGRRRSPIRRRFGHRRLVVDAGVRPIVTADDDLADEINLSEAANEPTPLGRIFQIDVDRPDTSPGTTSTTRRPVSISSVDGQ